MQAPWAVICLVFLPINIYTEVVFFFTNMIPLPSAPLVFQPVQPLNSQVGICWGIHESHTWNSGPRTSHAHIFLHYNQSEELQ